MPHRLLTDDLAASISPPRSGRKEIGDARVKGLVLRVTATGARTWSVGFKVPGQGGVGRRGTPLKGKSRRVTIGPVHAVKVEEARKQAQDILRDADRGVDPRPARRAANELRFNNTVRTVSARMVAEAKKTVRSWERMDMVFRVHIVPRIGEVPVSDITRAEVFALLDELKEEKTIATAREVRKQLGRLLNWSANRALIPTNPMAGLQDGTLVYKPRKRVLTDAELRAAWLAADSLGYPFGPAARLLILTGSRRQEILGATWAEVDRKARTLFVPPERHKSDRGHLIPLSDEAWRIVEALPERRGQDHLFTGRTGEPADFTQSNAKKLRDVVAALIKKDDPEYKLQHFVIHDLRRTCETRLGALEVPQEHIDRVLGHAQRGMARTYNHHDYLRQKRDALEKYAAHILELAQ